MPKFIVVHEEHHESEIHASVEEAIKMALECADDNDGTYVVAQIIGETAPGKVRFVPADPKERP